MTFSTVACITIFACILMAVGASLAGRHRRRHQHRTTMRKHKHIKIIVDECVSVDVALICPAHPRVRAEITLESDTLKVKGDITMFRYFTDQRIKGTIKPTDINGKPAGWENMRVTSSDPALGEVQALDEDPDNKLKFQVISPIASTVDWSANPNPRPFTISIDFDGKVGDEENPVHIEINGELAQRDASTAGVDLSAAEDYSPSGE